MLIPSIDLMDGRIVQLVHGERLALSFDDAAPWIERFSCYPLVQLVDLDAARRSGNNRALVERITAQLPVQIGGGIRSVAQAQELLNAGAQHVILGSVLFQDGYVSVRSAEEFASALGRQHLVFSLDSRGGCIAIHGWAATLPLTPEDAIAALEPYCGAFLYTHIDTEGTLQGFPLERALALRALTRHQLIVAGGIRSQQEVGRLDALNIDAVVGMAIYTGMLPT